MKTKTLWLVVLNLILCISAMAKSAQTPLAPATAAQMKTFDVLYAKSDVATLRGDSKYLNAILAPDFTARSFAGRTSNRAQRVRNISRFLQQVRFHAAKSRIAKLGFRGKQAFVIVDGIGEFTMRDAKGKPLRVRVAVRSTDTWISAKGSWLLQMTIETSSRVFVNGREVVQPVSSTR